jgi:hypothetical protein
MFPSVIVCTRPLLKDLPLALSQGPRVLSCEEAVLMVHGYPLLIATLHTELYLQKYAQRFRLIAIELD